MVLRDPPQGFSHRGTPTCACIIPSPACGTLFFISHCHHCSPHHYKYKYKCIYKCIYNTSIKIDIPASSFEKQHCSLDRFPSPIASQVRQVGWATWGIYEDTCKANAGWKLPVGVALIHMIYLVVGGCAALFAADCGVTRVIQAAAYLSSGALLPSPVSWFANAGLLSPRNHLLHPIGPNRE